MEATGVVLDEDTVTDGSCGLDAVFRGIDRLDDADESAAMKTCTNLVNATGRPTALHQMRQLAVSWLSEHENKTLVDGMSFK